MIHILDLNFLGIQQAIAAFLIETNDGLVLVESGPHSTYAALEQRLEALGFKTSDIQAVLLTHIHLDHAGAAWALAKQGATIYVHPAGARHLSDPSRLMESARRIYQDQMDRLWGSMERIPQDRLRTVEHKESLQFGTHVFRALHTPGHAIHHLAWELQEVIFTGDVAGVRIGKGPVVPPCPPPDINLEDWMNSINLIRGLRPRTLYLTHFGAITDVQEHLSALEVRMREWADWMHPYFERREAPEAITPLFQDFVQKQLREAGVDEVQLERYELANPSWMSVAGLMRYWQKKAGA